MKHFLFLTTTNLATNPRFYKELSLALGLGHRCTMVCFKLGNWSDDVSLGLLKDLKKSFEPKLRHIELDATSDNKLLWTFWGLFEKGLRFVHSVFSQNAFVNAGANTRRALQILQKGKSLNSVPDLIIAHNLGTLYPAYRLGRMYSVPFIFDMEDYYPSERHFQKNPRGERCCRFLLIRLLPKAWAFTSASPLIEKYTLDLIRGHGRHTVVLNSFPKLEFVYPTGSEHEIGIIPPLNIIWFSQKIGFGRGLEMLFMAMAQLATESPRPVRLILIGDLDLKFKDEIFTPFSAKLTGNVSVEVLSPMSQAAIHRILCYQDVGLALEFDRADLNRQLCLTNKIIAYAQAGLFILATDTMAQKHFIQETPERGALVEQSALGILKGLLKIIKEADTIRSQRRNRFRNARRLCWETESPKLLEYWRSSVPL